MKWLWVWLGLAFGLMLWGFAAWGAQPPQCRQLVAFAGTVIWIDSCERPGAPREQQREASPS